MPVPPTLLNLTLPPDLTKSSSSEMMIIYRHLTEVMMKKRWMNFYFPLIEKINNITPIKNWHILPFTKICIVDDKSYTTYELSVEFYNSTMNFVIMLYATTTIDERGFIITENNSNIRANPACNIMIHFFYAPKKNFLKETNKYDALVGIDIYEIIDYLLKLTILEDKPIFTRQMVALNLCKYLISVGYEILDDQSNPKEHYFSVSLPEPNRIIKISLSICNPENDQPEEEITPKVLTMLMFSDGVVRDHGAIPWLDALKILKAWYSVSKDTSFTYDFIKNYDPSGAGRADSNNSQ